MHRLSCTQAKATDRLTITTSQATNPHSQDDVDIIDLSKKCSELSKELHTELDELTVSRRSLRQSVSKGVLASRRKDFVKEKQNLLEKYQNVLTTHILTKLDTRSLKVTHDIQLLDRNVQGIIHALDSGQTAVKNLVADHNREIRDQVESFTSRIKDHDAHQWFLESLFFPEINSRQEQIPEAFRETCRWIFDSPTGERRGRDQPHYRFHEWLRAGKGVYWISGKPGSGKSTLMKFIVDEELTVQLLDAGKGNQDPLMISFFFWSAGTALQKSAAGLLRSLLYQIARECPELVKLVTIQSSKSLYGFESSTALRAAWTDQRLLSALATFIDKMPAHLSLCVFVDGLDEFEGDEDLLLDMVRLFSNALRCKICVSSRPEQAFRHEFRECPQLRIQDFTRKDIHRMASGKLIPVLEKYLDTSKQSLAGNVTHFVDTLVKMASGVFLWLDLMIKDLIKGAKNGDTIEQLQSRLERTPATIDGMYAHILENLDPIYHREGLKYFAILFAAEDLEISVTLLLLVCAQGEPWEHAAQFDLDYFTTMHFESTCQRLENRLIACCGGLIDISDRQEYKDGDDKDWKYEGKEAENMEVEEDRSIIDESRAIGFTHKTAMEYVRQRYNHQMGLASPGEANAYLARGGIGFLTLLSSRQKCGTKPKITRIFREWFRFTMRTISALGCLVSEPHMSESSVSIQIDLTNQIFRSIQEIHNQIYQSAQDCWSNEIFKVDLIEQYSDSAEICIKDRLSAAAFHGCNHYLSSRLSMGRIEEQLATDLLQATLCGIDRDLYSHFSVRSISYLPNLLIMQTILQHALDPQKLYSTPLLGLWPTKTRSTLWGEFLRILSEIFDRFGVSDAKVVPASFELCSVALTEAFLLQGADPNTKIQRYHNVYRIQGGYYAMAEMESPLVFIDSMRSVISSKLHLEFTAQLKSAGAKRYRDFLYLTEITPQAEDGMYYPLWRLSDVQKNRLDEIVLDDSAVDLTGQDSLESYLPEIEKFDGDEVNRYFDTSSISFSDVPVP